MRISLEHIGKAQDKYLESIPQCNELWLTEAKLGDVLKIIFKDENIIHDKKLDLLNHSNFRPDYLLPNRKLLVEFQGYQHFTITKIACKDIIKQKAAIASGYQLIEVPYFVQLTKNVTIKLFNEQIDKNLRKLNFSNNFPHGFIHPKATLPYDYCSLGLRRFKEFLNNLPNEVRLQCHESTKLRAKIDGIPDSIYMPLLNLDG